MAENELESALALADNAGKILLYLSPDRHLLRFHKGDLSDPKLHEEFIDHFWPKDRGDWRQLPGSRVNTFCYAEYFLAMREAIYRTVIKTVGPVAFYEAEDRLSSDTWIGYWLQGARGFRGVQTVGEDYAKRMNDQLALKFPLNVDPRMIANSGATDVSMSPIVKAAMNKLSTHWGGFDWKWETGGDYGHSVVTVSKLLAYEASKDKSPDAIGSFGLKSNDQRGGWLVDGLDNEENVMQEHIWRELTNLISLDDIYEQIQRAPAPSYRE